jgi:hypothetical protein
VGTYTISLTVKDINGCTSLPATDNLLVNPLPKVNAGADKFIQTGSSILMDATVTPAGSYKYQWTPAAGLNAMVFYCHLLRQPIQRCTSCTQKTTAPIAMKKTV